MNSSKFIRLSTITNRIDEILQPYTIKTRKEPFWVKAEIASSRERGGNYYCDLVETNSSGKIIAKFSCIIWNREFKKIKNKFIESDIKLNFSDGSEVGFLCSLNYSSQYGLSLAVSDADTTFAIGVLENKKREIIEKLKKEGLFEINKRIYLPTLPTRIGLITSKNSDAYNDFVSTLFSTPFGFKIVLSDAYMQGKQTQKSILNALDQFLLLDVELVVIVRGGGSKTDIYDLDNEMIARKIANYSLPVWTGIGHEIDQSVLDLVANCFFKTPTAVAEELVSRFTGIHRQLENATTRLKSIWSFKLNFKKDEIVKDRVGLKQGTRKLVSYRRILFHERPMKLDSLVKKRLNSEETKINQSRINIINLVNNEIKIKKESIFQNKKVFKNSSNWKLEENKIYIKNIYKRFQFDRYSNAIELQKNKIKSFYNSLENRSNEKITSYNKNFNWLMDKIKSTPITLRINNEKKLIVVKTSTLQALDPKNNLRKGFSITRNENGQLIKSIDDLESGDHIFTEIFDGEIKSSIKKVSINEKIKED